ncbi:lasso peptide biosynthesis B2 protein [Acinetobacter sp. Ac_5812]|uniref:lasso peptide biosynthesis B2 protein n=1 Tax=Acinetobacter sp. Ac_5812 TaxID=1848937 RepID=UPI00148F5BDF|nr:lasso peptide biosynthesis B2 protein [Acinetobacter sp. Ac_5812]
MNIKLQQGVFSCIADESLIFLDSNEMKYFQLDIKKTQLLLDYCKNTEDRENFDKKTIKLLNSLEENSLLRFVDDLDTVINRESFFSKKIAKPEDSIYSLTFFNRDKLNFKDFLIALSVNIYVRFKFKFFYNPMKINRGKTIFFNDFDQQKLIKIIGLYNSALVFTPWRGVNKCLLKSMALKYFLNLNGYNADLIIGVRANPFFAHAWLQIDNVVLNDNIDKVGDYQPIMRIR